MTERQRTIKYCGLFYGTKLNQAKDDLSAHRAKMRLFVKNNLRDGVWLPGDKATALKKIETNLLNRIDQIKFDAQ